MCCVDFRREKNASKTKSISRPPKVDVDTVNTRFERTDPVFVHPIVPGYQGFTPRLNDRIGQRYTVLATEGLAEFEREQLRLMEARNQLRKIIDVQSGRGEPRSLEERLLIQSQFKSPLLVVRPEYMGMTRSLSFDEQRMI